MWCGGRKTIALGIKRLNATGAALRGEVRIQNGGGCAGSSFVGDVRLAGATRSGEVRVDGCSLHNWWGRAGLLNFWVNDECMRVFEIYICVSVAEV